MTRWRTLGWLLAYVVSVALWIALFAVAGYPGVYVLLGFGVLAAAAFYGTGRDR